MHNLTRSSNVLFSSFCGAFFSQKRIRRFYLWTFSELLDDTKATFELIDVKFGIIWHMHSPGMHDTHNVRFLMLFF